MGLVVDHFNFKREDTSTMVPPKKSNLPDWLSLQTVISIMTLLGLIGGFYANYAVQSERIVAVTAAFARHQEQAERQLKELGQELQRINAQLAYLQGKEDAIKKK